MSDGPQGLPGWLAPVVEAADTITVHELTRFMPPEDSDARRGAVLMVFADRDDDPTRPTTSRTAASCCSPSAPTTCAPTPARSPSRAARSTRGRRRCEAALREAHEEIGLDPAEVEVFGELPELWLPPSNFAVTPVLGYWRDRGEVRIESPDEVHAIHHVAIADLLDPDHRINVAPPERLARPGLPHRRPTAT